MKAYTIVELHNLFKNKELSISEYYQSLFVELEKQNKRLNALVTITKEEALKKISNLSFDPSNMLSAIPVVYKDNYSTEGIRTTASSKILDNYLPIYSATAVNKLEDNNTVIVAKASLDELAMGGTNRSAYTGPVHNPWDTTRISGGSSGGSAAIVASGVVPFALGSDTGDSIRKPAGFCGVVGFKPTWGRISRYGVIPYATSLDHLGAFTRTIEDMSIVIGALSGRDDHDMTSSMKEVPDYYQNLNNDIKGVKIAILKNVYDEVTNQDIIDNINVVIEKFKELGAIVEFVSMEQQLMKAILPAYVIIANSEAMSNHSCLDGIKYGVREPGDSPDEIMIESRTKGFSSFIKRRFVLGNLALATENQEKMFRKAQKVRRLIVDNLNQIYKEYDIILTPVSGDIAPTLEDASDDRLSEQYLILENHLILGNFAGTPSLTLPSGFSKHLPIGINIMGRLFEEQTVLNVAYALEAVLPYKNQYHEGSED